MATRTMKKATSTRKLIREDSCFSINVDDLEEVLPNTLTVAEAAASMASCKSLSQLQAGNLLDSIRGAMELHLSKEMELEDLMAEQMAKMAKMNVSGGDGDNGNMSSTDDIERLKLEQKKLSSAIEILESHAMDLEARIGQARATDLAALASSVEFSDDDEYDECIRS
jgi:hypothetical protein